MLLSVRILYIFWILIPYETHDFQIFSLISYTNFSFVECFLDCIEVSSFEVASLVYFLFFSFAFDIKKIIAMTNIKELSLCAFFYEFYGFRSYVRV